MLRINPIAVEVVRAPIEDDILPLTKPIVGTSGRVYTELPIPKGTTVTISTIGYSRYVRLIKPPPQQCPHYCFHDSNQDLWGPDAHCFRPERWLGMDEQVDSPVGVYGNLYGNV